MNEDIMNREIELTDLSENQSEPVSPSSTSPCPSENVIIEIPRTPSCWKENRCTILFWSSAALGFLWVGLNLGGYI